jgi:hypothetical protein
MMPHVSLLHVTATCEGEPMGSASGRRLSVMLVLVAESGTSRTSFRRA